MQPYHQVNPLPVYDLSLGHTAYHPVGASDSKGWSLDRVVDVVKPAIIAGAAYHGYRRNKSILWAIGWVVAAKFSPLITTGIAVAQGFGARKEGC